MVGLPGNPILKLVLGKVLEKALEGKVTPAERPAIIAKAAAEASADPVLVNEMNAEPLYQSRTFVGSAAGFFGALAIVLQQYQTHPFLQYDWAVMLPALGVVWATAFSIYGRARGGLKPLFSRR